MSNIDETVNMTIRIDKQLKKEIDILFKNLGLTTSAAINMFLKQCNREDMKIISKIESARAIENLDEIIDVTDGIMVARGDLGVEVPMQQLPKFQKLIMDTMEIAKNYNQNIITNLQYIKALLKDYKKICPKSELWLGGPEVSYRAKELLLEFPRVRGVMVGEGEETFFRLLSFYDKNISFCSCAQQDMLEDVEFSKLSEVDRQGTFRLKIQIQAGR